MRNLTQLAEAMERAADSADQTYLRTRRQSRRRREARRHMRREVIA